MDTKTFTTTHGHKIEVKTFVTGRQVQQFTDGIADDITKEKRNQAISNKSIEILVVSVDDSKENILDTVLDLPFDDYKEILETVNAIVDPKKNATTTATT